MVKLRIFCAFLLFLANTAQCFVLLTANMQDIKKIASNFVSDALAEKIAEFVVKATEQITEKGADSTKTKMNSGDIDVESQELNANNRQRDEKPIYSDIYKQNYPKEEKKSYNYKAEYDDNKDKYKQRYWSKEKNSQEKPDRFDHEQKKWHKEVIEISNEHQDRESKNDWRSGYNKFGRSNEKTDRPTRISTRERDYWKKKDESKNKISSEERPQFKYDDNDYKDDYKQKSQQNNQNNIINFYTKAKTDNNMIKKPRIEESKTDDRDFPKYESKSYQRPHATSNEKPYQDQRETKRDRYKNDAHSDESRDTKFNKESRDTTRFRSAFEITTKKEKTDFDQYDNRNYPKAEFIATSGNVMLPRVHETRSRFEEDGGKTKKTWWEKEMPNSDAKVKTWLATA